MEDMGFEEVSASGEVVMQPPTDTGFPVDMGFPAATAATTDPASEFLEREKEELGDLGDLGVLAEPDAPAVEALPVETLTAPVAAPMGRMGSGGASPVMMMASDRMPRIEPETIRTWREEHARRLAEKDAREEEMLTQLRDQAKKELADWYKHHKDQVDKTKSANRSAEMEFVAEVNDIRPGTEWERVSKLVDFNSKHSKVTKDTSRMKSIMLQLKQSGKVAA